MQGRMPVPHDPQEGRIKVSVDPDLQELIPSFLQHRRQEITLLQEAFARSDYETIGKLAHTIKGVGGGYGFKRLSEITESLELAVLHRNSSDIQNELSALVDYLARVEVVYEAVPEGPLVICVDDEPSILTLMERTLTKKGFRVMGSLGGDKAISLIHERKPDLILMDIKMPEINGFDICARLKKSEDVAKIPVIFVTGMAEEVDRTRAFSSGACDVLLKPFDMDVLVEKAQRTLEAAKS
jgi:CheY-like chemotaxis protein